MDSCARSFLADLANAKQTHLDNILAIQRGESDGEVFFKYINDRLDEPLEIRVLATDVTSYPRRSSFFVFTSSETCDPKIPTVLQKISASTAGSRLRDVIVAVSNKLTKTITALESSASDHGSSDESLDSYKAADAIGFVDVVSTPDSGPLFGHYQRSPEELELIERDFKVANLAGILVETLQNETSKRIEAIYLAMKASDIAVTPEAMSAWDINPAHYIVLLVRFPERYTDVDVLLRTSEDSIKAQFRFGTCELVKPSMKSMRLAFDHELIHRKDRSSTFPVADDHQSSETDIYPLLMSDTINTLLNHHLVKLLQLRRNLKCTWDEAQAKLFKKQQENRKHVENKQQDMDDVESCHNYEHPISTNIAINLELDFAMDERESFSLPMVAMQFALRRLCKCTEYCMVCHRRLKAQYQTLKPFVCSDMLCSYQYLSLGLGPNLEHEIKSNPHVVDILVSLFYAAISTQTLREYPSGLALRAPLISPLGFRARIEIRLKSSIFRLLPNAIDSESKVVLRTLREGDWFIMMTGAENSFEKHTCRVKSIMSEGMHSFQRMRSVKNPVDTPDEIKNELFGDRGSLYDKVGWQLGIIFPFAHDVQDLDTEGRNSALMNLLDSIPSVLETRSHLLGSSARRLSSWENLNPSALSLMRWIVASNTSYIVQDGPILAKNDDDTVPSGLQAVKKDQMKSSIIQGLDNDWVQFRFAQGSPQTEFQFFKATQEQINRTGPENKPSTLFAWHGSPVSNWHSIIRKGLDFQSNSHGRSYGNGVYFSKDMSVSCGYSGAAQAPSSGASHRYWPRSDLRIAAAVSICELINRPDQFVSKSPHFVIDKLDWIQCRYLLLRVDPTAEALKNPLFAPAPSSNPGYVVQDPEHFISGYNGPLKIPVNTLSMKRRQDAFVFTLINTTTGPRDGSVDNRTVENNTDVPLRLERTNNESKGLKRPRISFSGGEDHDLESTACPKRILDNDQIDQSSTKRPRCLTFTPGTLDVDSLHLLPEPEWATSSSIAPKTLAKEISQLHKAQDQHPIDSLGWYINTTKVQNLFQWIVELHTFEPDLPLAKDMEQKGCTSIILEIRFGPNFPFSPPFVRIIRPRFLPFMKGGGGHVTTGGAICSEVLTNSGWSPAMSMENVLVHIRSSLCDTERHARLEMGPVGAIDYGIGEAVEAYRRAANAHGWSVSEDLEIISAGWTPKSTTGQSNGGFR